MKQFGVGLAVAIASDATVVRCVLVPTVMVMMGGQQLMDAITETLFLTRLAGSK